MPHIDVGGLSMYHERHGDGSPLILLHGAGGCIASPAEGWASLRGPLSRRYHCVEVDYRGHGRTARGAGELSYAVIAADIAHLVELPDLSPVHIGGVSDGAIAAIHMAMTRPELIRSVTCVGVNYMNDEQVVAANRALDVDVIVRDDPALADELAILHARPGEPPDAWRQLIIDIAANLAVNPHYSLDELATIAAPVMLMAGELDLWANLDQMVAMRRAIPNSELLIINNAGHTIQHTHPEVVGPAMLDFLRRVEADGDRPPPAAVGVTPSAHADGTGAGRIAGR